VWHRTPWPASTLESPVASEELRGSGNRPELAMGKSSDPSRAKVLRSWVPKIWAFAHILMAYKLVTSIARCEQAFRVLTGEGCT